MEAIISNLLDRFEKGSLTRRGLVQGLALLTAAGAAEAQAPGVIIKATKIDHISIQVDDLPKSIAFYQKIFDFTVLSEDKPNEIVRLGSGKVLVSLHHKSPTRIMDHYAIGVEGFNKETMTKELIGRGVTPSDNLDAGFHIVDPSGISVQIVGG